MGVTPGSPRHRMGLREPGGRPVERPAACGGGWDTEGIGAPQRQPLHTSPGELAEALVSLPST